MPIKGYDLFAEENYVQAWRAAQAEEAERRSEAFFDVARPVAGIPLRHLTARDMHVLDGFRSPFVCGDPAAATPEHIISVLWLLRYQVPGGLLGRIFGHSLHRAYLRRRWRTPGLREEDHAELIVWFNDVFADSGAPRRRGDGQGRTTIGVHFLAGLLLDIACEAGAVDPSTGLPLIESPLPRLFQYQKILRAKREKGEFVDFNGADQIKSAALAAWNALPAEEKEVWETRAAALNAPPAA